MNLLIQCHVYIFSQIKKDVRIKYNKSGFACLKAQEVAIFRTRDFETISVSHDRIVNLKMTIKFFDKQLYIEALLMAFQLFRCFQSRYIKTVYSF